MINLKYWFQNFNFSKIIGAFVGPRILLVSIPKAGTNLAIRMFELFPQLRYKGRINISRDKQEQIIDEISRIKRGQVLSTHMRWIPSLNLFLNDQGIKGFFTIRDPRDVCVSYYHYVMRISDHWCHTYFKEVLPDNYSRLMATITGINKTLSDGSQLYLESINEVYYSRKEFLSQSSFFVLKFEDIIGQKGGGDERKKESVIKDISSHIGIKLTSSNIKFISKNMYSPNSPTFRHGQIGSWKNEMCDEHKEKFKEITGKLLIDLHYESDNNW